MPLISQGFDSCGGSTEHTGAKTSVLLGIPGPRQVDASDVARDGLPPLPHTVISSGVYRNAEDLPPPRAFTDRPQLETNIQLLDLGDGAWWLNHALRQQQIYGGLILRDAYEDLLDGHLPNSAELTQSLQSCGFVAPPEQPPEAFHRSLMATEDAKAEVHPSFTLPHQVFAPDFMEHVTNDLSRAYATVFAAAAMLVATTFIPVWFLPKKPTGNPPRWPQRALTLTDPTPPPAHKSPQVRSSP